MSAWRIARVTCTGTRAAAFAEPGLPLLLVFPANATGEALAGAFAVRNGAAVLGRISAVRQDGPDLVATRTTHGGGLLLTLRVAPGLAVATANDLACDEAISLGEPDDLAIEREPLADSGVSLEAANIVIGGGRGLDSAGFSLLEHIARMLNGAVAASLPAVDLGLAPVSRQVGQSGKFVNPAIYFAVGLSGTPQHFAGVGDRAQILAINRDRDAPIFGFADIGVEADAGVLLPLLIEELECFHDRERWQVSQA